jgi:hypothetical protein
MRATAGRLFTGRRRAGRTTLGATAVFAKDFLAVGFFAAGLRVLPLVGRLPLPEPLVDLLFFLAMARTFT